jgi:DMSO/TMAO reductase YedYZ molybdopterin-dependent catalytic subunit/thiosulfate reductase cytochrome b subunit
MPAPLDPGFPLAIRLAHALNLVFVTLLIRSGVEILGAHPMLYWNDDCRPGSEWIRFSPKRMPRDRHWTAEDEQQRFTPWVALPGRGQLGLGRFWHFSAAIGWLLTGIGYLVALATNGEWHRLVPTTWRIVPAAWTAALTYLRLGLPPPGHPYNALQQLTYFALVFGLTPLQIATGLALSPALAARVPWYPRLFGGRQAARSIHFLGLVAFVVFIVHHVALVIAHGLQNGLAAIVLGVEHPTAPERALAVAIALAFFAALALLHVWATRWSLVQPADVQRGLQRIVDPVQSRFLQRLTSHQHYPASLISSSPRANGRPPRHGRYVELAAHGFDGWRLRVDGLVRRPMAFTLDELRGLGTVRQITEHKCIQGWSYIAEWEGLPLSVLLDRCGPTSDARYVLFRTFDDKWEAPGHGEYYCVIDLKLARAPQTLLAYGMNGQSLPVVFGAPLRLRLETQLGYKMVKWVRSVELIDDYASLGAGQGGWRADQLHYGRIAPI